MSGCRSIAVVAPDCCAVSVGSVAWHHAIELSRRFTVHVISKNIPPPPDAAVIPHPVAVRSWGVLRRLAHVPNELAFVSAVRSELQRLCRETSIDLVWCHGHVTAALAAVPLRRRFGFGVVMTTHGDIFNRPAGMYDPLLTRFYRAVTPRAYRQADAVHVLSPYLGEAARRRGASTVISVPNGIDAADIGLDSRPVFHGGAPENPSRWRLLFVGPLGPVKGVDVLLKALFMLLQNAPQLEWELVIVGIGPEEARLKAMTDESGLTDRVFFKGRCKRTELSTYYLNADLLCVPSLDDAFPTVVLEGLACGLPVIGSRAGGIPSMIEEGRTGFLSEPNNPAALADSVLAAVRFPGGLSEMRNRCVEAARVQYGWSQIGVRLCEIAERVLSENKKGFE